jgi:hypothetical protein
MKYERLTKRGVDWHDDVQCDDEEVYNRLAELEDKIENGTLVELPCKVGDTLYYVNMYASTPRIEANFVHTIEMFEEGITGELTLRIWTQDGVFYSDNMPNVFKTKSEAEKKTKGVAK